MHITKWAILLSIFWLLLSGFIQPLLLSFGVASVFIVLVVLKRMDSVDQEPKTFAINQQMFRYVFWLMGQIFLSSVHVTKLIWGSSDKVSPALAKIPVNRVSAENHVLYANSITLTPGTLSIDLDDENITVHSLQAASIKELEQGDMESKITGLWGEKK